MKKIWYVLILILFLILLSKVIFKEKGCEIDSDCVAFGDEGDCNCGCYLKDEVPKEHIKGCFCAAPKECECVDGVCLIKF